MKDYEPYSVKPSVKQLNLTHSGTEYKTIDVSTQPFVTLYKGTDLGEAISIAKQHNRRKVVITEEIFSVYTL